MPVLQLFTSRRITTGKSNLHASDCHYFFLNAVTAQAFSLKLSSVEMLTA